MLLTSEAGDSVTDAFASLIEPSTRGTTRTSRDRATPALGPTQFIAVSQEDSPARTPSPMTWTAIARKRRPWTLNPICTTLSRDQW